MSKNEDAFKGLEGRGIDLEHSPPLFPMETRSGDQAAIASYKRDIWLKEAVFERKVDCPVCDVRFLTKSLKSNKQRLVDTDTDLRPIYDKVDPLLYDAIVCSTCGYAAVTKSFKQVNSLYIDAFKEKVSSKFKARSYGEFYTHEEAIERYQLALYSATLLKATNFEKAYLCLKIAWIYRGYQESLDETQTELKADCIEKENKFLAHALQGFQLALETEKFPQLELDALTVTFLVGELSRRLGHVKEAYEVMRKLQTSQGINQRLKKRIEAVISLIRED